MWYNMIFPWYRRIHEIFAVLYSLHKKQLYFVARIPWSHIFNLWMVFWGYFWRHFQCFCWCLPYPAEFENPPITFVHFGKEKWHLEFWKYCFVESMFLEISCSQIHLLKKSEKIFMFHICLEPEAKGHGMTFKVSNVSSNYLYFTS